MDGKKAVSLVVAGLLLAGVAFAAFGHHASPDRLLAPSIFYSYDSAGNVSQMMFSLDEEGGTTAVDVYDDTYEGTAAGRHAEELAYEYDAAEGEVRFGGRVWKIEGESGSRVLHNVSAQDGAGLWGTYYEDEGSARAATPYDAPR